MKKIYLAGYCHLSPALFALAKAARCNMRKVPYLESLSAAEPENVPSLFRDNAVKYMPVSCDNWKWSDNNPYVKVAIAHCGDAIVLHFHVADHELRAVETVDDGRVWEDSCCEFFVSPDCNDLYYNFECNCIGTLLLHGGVRPDRPAAPAECFEGVKRWSSLGKEAIARHVGEVEWDLVEIIPVSSFFLHDIKTLHGKVMSANFYKCGDLLESPHFLSWAPIDLPNPMFHCPEFFGKLQFE